MGWEFSCMEKVANPWKRAQVYEERAARDRPEVPLGCQEVADAWYVAAAAAERARAIHLALGRA